jgi:hypothetical protein
MKSKKSSNKNKPYEKTQYVVCRPKQIPTHSHALGEMKVYFVEPEDYQPIERKLTDVPKTFNVAPPSVREANLPAVVYAITDGTYTKIGYTTNLRQRIESLQTGNPNQLVVLETREFDTAIEAYKHEQLMHKRLASFHVRGEWFDAPYIKL